MIVYFFANFRIRHERAEESDNLLCLIEMSIHVLFVKI